jgi:hypothetical protein
VNKQLGMLTVVATVLLTGAFLAIPTMKTANAQGNETQGNQSMAQGLPVDAWIKILKDKNPAIADVEQDSKVKDAIGKIKEMKDPKQAVDTFNALQTLTQLMNLKSAQEGQ